ncbi:MAG: phospholipase D-like domain-containing protein [Burkholderiales bacterium]
MATGRVVRLSRCVVIVGALLGAAACTIAPLQPAGAAVPVPQASATSAKGVAQQVGATGPQGRMSRSEREDMLARLGEQGKAPLVNRHLAAMTRFGDVDLHAHNDAKLLIDGPATFAAMFAAIGAARESVLLESYIIEDSTIADRLAELLERKRRQGVAVALLYDDVGTLKPPQAFFDRLRAAGVGLCAFNPVNPLKRLGYWNISHRDHRKILAVDRTVAFTGGINISGVYATGSFSRGQRASNVGWRDTQVQLRGPAAGALDDLVRKTWQQQGCRDALPPMPARANAASAGEQVVRIVPSSPADPANRIYTLLLTAVDAAQQSVYLTMAYFAPSPDMIDALCDAAGRGVDVQLVLPSQSDFWPVLHAGRSHYRRLLAAGVKVHELQDAVLHAKTAVIDGVVSTVGSSNMDWRSISSNNEVDAVVFGDDFGQGMVRMFRQDVAASEAITAEAWAHRPLLQRAKEWLARNFDGLW